VIYIDFPSIILGW